MYVAGHTTNSVSVIDTRTSTLVEVISGFEDPSGVGYNSDTGNTYITNHGSNYVSIISGSTNKVIDTVTVGGGPVGAVFDPDNGNMYITNYEASTVSVIATRTPIQPPTQTTINSATDGNGNPVQDGGSTVSTSITLQVTATPGTNPMAGFECSLDGGTFSTCAKDNPATINFDDLAAGQQCFCAFQYKTRN
jgi:YVTN family beta-propeller protein